MPRNYCGRDDCGCNDVEAEDCPNMEMSAQEYADTVVQVLRDQLAATQSSAGPRDELTIHLLPKPPVTENG